MVARWKPVHLGHAAVLRALADAADEAVVGVGSSNRYDARNPFTAEETREMLRLVLGGRSNVSVVDVPDLGDGPRWRELVRSLFGDLDLFVTDNPYVASLLGGVYRLEKPVSLVPESARVAVDGTEVRREMAKGDGWRRLVPPDVAAYLSENRIDERFRREFGLATLASSLEDAHGAALAAG